jgi:polar amino acid transport system substrate-binding protein
MTAHLKGTAMSRIALVVLSMLILAACATAPEVTPAARADLAPGGKLRAGINFNNVLLTAKDAVTGAPGGIAVDLAHELGRRLGVPVEIVPYDGAGKLADAAKAREWDVGFLGAEPQRAKEIIFTAAYLEIESTYLVPAGSPLKTVADVDRQGVRIAVSASSAYDLYLTRSLKQATLQRALGVDNAYKLFVAEKLDALAGLKPRLVTDSDKLPGSRILEGRFTAVQQAVGTLPGREAGAKYLWAFVEDIKASGLVAQTIEKNGVRGVTVAPPAPY